MEEENNIQKECPICHKKFESEFALKGHLRLMKDEDHVTFRNVDNKKDEKKITLASLSTPFAGLKLLDQVEARVENQEKKYTIQAEQDAFITRLEDFVARERENDIAFQHECFQKGYDRRTQEYEKYIIPKFQEQKKTEFAEKEKKIRTECAAEKERELYEMKYGYEEKIYDLNREHERERYGLISKYGISVPCPLCNSDKLVETNSQLHFEIRQLMIREGIGHPECVRMYDPNKAYSWDCTYINYCNFLAQNYRRSV